MTSSYAARLGSIAGPRFPSRPRGPPPGPPPRRESRFSMRGVPNLADPHPDAMTDHIRERIARKLSTLGDERLYQVLDYVEFLELRYGQPAAAGAATNPLQRFADGIEDRLRAGGVAASTVSEAMGFLNKAVGVLNDVATAGSRVASDFATAAQRMTTTPPTSAPGPTTSVPGAATGAGGSSAQRLVAGS